ncbi:MAG: hypothetical protein ACTSPV_00630 [Candidatus Hodarchaeales archaeon]
MPKVSVVIVTYRRKANLGKIISAWLNETSNVWLCDCSKEGMRYSDINYVYCYPDPGNKIRHAVALLTRGDYVIKTDDDLLPKPGLINDFLRNRDKGGILGIHGRKFNGESYYRNTKALEGKEIKEITEVDFVGICTFTPRDNLAFDLRGCKSPIEDLFWQMKAFPHIRKWVISTKNYEKLPESNDEECLFFNKKARQIREAFYNKYYLRNYR